MNSTVAAETHFDEKLLTVSKEMDAFEGYTRPHGVRVAAIADTLGRSFNLASHDRRLLQQAGLIHDIGEMVMDREYFRANRILGVEEQLDLQRHPVIGEQEAAKLGLPRGVQLLIRWHHEWWNGGGYPDALHGDQIPLAARILRVADTFAALSESRPYRAALEEGEVLKYLTEWAGIEFDPAVVKAFLSLGYRDTPEEETSPLEL
jgi:HD-GYP domain-containing protein (c-di-GMP phosphodiesterase class II)